MVIFWTKEKLLYKSLRTLSATTLKHDLTLLIFSYNDFDIVILVVLYYKNKINVITPLSPLLSQKCLSYPIVLVYLSFPSTLHFT